MLREQKFESPTYMLSAEVKLGDALPSCFSFHGIKSIGAMFFCIFVPFFVTSLLTMVSTCSAKVVSYVTKCKKAMMCIMEKICVLSKLCIKMNL